MRILHTSDWHLGQTFINRDRDEEHQLALNWLLQTIENQQVECLIVAGDIFDTFNPSNAARQLYYNFLREILKTNCRHTVIIGGNHDSPSMLTAPKELLKEFNVHVVGATEIDDLSDEIIELKDAKGNIELVVAAVPFLRDRDLVYATAGESGLERIERIKKGIYDHYHTIGKAVKKYKKSKIPVVATGHLYAMGAEASDKQNNIYIGDKSNIKAKDFPKEFDYVALGHIHRPQVIGGLTHVRYSGSPIPLSFSETKDEKLIYLIDFQKDTIKEISDIKVPPFRRLKTISGGVEHIFKNLTAFAERHQEELLPWVEVIVEAEEVAPDIDAQIREFAKDLHLEILKIRIYRKVDRKDLFTQSVNLEDLDVMDVFKKKCDRMGVPAKEMKELENSLLELKEGLEQSE